MKKKKSELYRNEIKANIVRAGMTVSEVMDYLADEYGWSSSVPNLSGTHHKRKESVKKLVRKKSDEQMYRKLETRVSRYYPIIFICSDTGNGQPLSKIRVLSESR